MNVSPWMLERMEQLGWVLVHFFWQGAVIGGGIWLVRVLLSKRSAHLRYLVLCGGLATCGLAPCLTWVALAKSGVARPAPPVRVADTRTAPTLPRTSVTAGAAAPGLPSVAVPESGSRIRDLAPLSHAIQKRLPLLVKIWGVGVTLLSLKLLYGWMQVRRLCRSGVPVRDRQWTDRFDALAERMGIRRGILFLESMRVEVPTVVGWLKPVVLVPIAFLGSLPASQIEAILAHELAHIRRFDYLVNVVQMVMETLLFYHPAIWWLGRVIREEREYCCDDLAVQVAGDKSVYVQALAGLEDNRSLGATMALAATGGTLIARIRRLVGERQVARRRPSSLAPSLIAVTVVMLCAGGFYRSTAEPSREVNEDPFGNRDLTQGQTDEVRSYRSSFRTAVIEDKLVLVEAFLRHGIQIEPPNLNTGIGDILYDAAYFTRDPRMIRLLLAHGAKPGGGVHERVSTVNSTLRLGNKEMVDLLISAGAVCDPLWYDAALGQIDDLKKREAQEPMDAKVSSAALEYAVSAGQVETFDWLWAKARGDDAAAQAKKLEGFYNRAADNGHLALLQHLEQIGVKPPDGGVKALSQAIGRNHVAEAKYLLEKGVALPKNPYLLRDAAGEGYLEIVRLLIDHGADLNATDSQSFTPLAWAAYNGRDEVGQLLVQRGADLEIPDHTGHTALTHVVGSIHSPGTLALMLEKGVHLDGGDDHGRSLWDSAFNFVPHQAGQTGFPGRVLTRTELREYEQREERVIDLLVAAGISPSGKEGTVTPLKAALRSNHYPAARALLRHHPDLNVKDEEGNPPIIDLFHWCHSRFPLDVLQSFLEQGCDPNASFPIPGLKPRTDLTVLETALGSFRRADAEGVDDHREAIHLLLEHGGKFSGVKSAADQALLAATARGDLPKMMEAVAKGAALDAKETAGYTPLGISASLHFFDNVFWLLGEGADPKRGYVMWGESLLPAAVRANRADVVNQLIAKGVDASGGNSGLNAAVEAGNEEIFDALIGAGADPKDATLFTCIQSGRTEMARVLLERGVDPQPQPMMENRGNVYWAVYYDRPEILKMLLEHGANPKMVDAYGETPLAMAKQFHAEMVAILEEAIAKRESEAKGNEAK